ncbi:MAG: hypothetical protein HYS13_01030 [Planctomycetia bacterium]|nr:hypothetical protein [Planctomycetia bacterium]
MLFSRDDVATFITNNFEPVWEAVRPVPIVEIDFGNGRKVTRTLHGNIATYVCDADGWLFDVLPGIYEPAAYLDGLNQFRLLHNYALQVGGHERNERMKAYHEASAAALAKNEDGPRLVNAADLSKARIERGLKAMLVPAGSSFAGKRTADDERGGAVASGDLAVWKELWEDTRLNESVRRREIHAKLAESGPVKPGEIKKWLYKEVLHADLDDPYLGLGEMLVGSDPFRGEPER